MCSADSVSKIGPSLLISADTVTAGALAKSFFSHSILSLGMNHPNDLNYLSQPSAQYLNEFSFLYRKNAQHGYKK